MIAQKILVMLFVISAVSLPGSLYADTTQAFLDESDQYFAKARAHLTDPQTQDLYLKSFQSAVKAIRLNPNSYDANWKAARGARSYYWFLKNYQVANYKAKSLGIIKEGIQYGAKAAELSPNKVEGHFWHGSCVASYADAVSVLTALKEGLAKKVQTIFERAYRIDESYWDYCGNLALGEYWYMLPWPLQDKAKARMYLERNLKLISPDSDNLEESMVMFGRVLLESKDKADQARGKALLEKSLNGRFPYFRSMARDVLSGKKVE